MRSRTNVARTVRSIRKDLGLTQQEFATRLRVALPTVSRWETQVHKPSRLALERIESFLRGLGERGERLRKKYLDDIGSEGGP